MKTTYFLTLAILFISIISGCKSYNDPIIYSAYEPRAVAAETDQTYILRVQGKGQTREDAINNALSQAIRDVIFKDIHVTYGDHKPLMRLINNPSEEANHSTFFSNFFSSAGNYLDFVTPINKNQDFYSSGTTKTVIMNVRVERGALKAYLTENKIIK